MKKQRHTRSAVSCWALALFGVTHVGCSGDVVQLGDGALDGTPPAAAATCDDGVQNGSETGIDCGGSACGVCFDEPCLCDATSSIMPLTCAAPQTEHRSLLMSEDGSALTFSLCSASGECRAYYWSAETGRRQLPAIAERVFATRLSANGQLMLLDAEPIDDSGSVEVVVYRLGGSPTPTGLMSYPRPLLSEDGSVVVGLARTSAGAVHLARWSETGGLETLSALFEDGSAPELILSAMTPEASLVVGAIFADVWQPFRWSEAEGLILGLEGLAAPADGAALLAVSRDGESLAGVTYAGFIRGVEVFHWTPTRGLINLGSIRSFGPPWPGMLSLSDDGSVVAGTLADNNGGPDDIYPFRWTEEPGVMPLVNDGAPSFEMRFMSGDGSVIVGALGQSNPVVWTKVGDHDQPQVSNVPSYRHLSDPQDENRRWELHEVTALSHDGSVIAGSGKCAGVPALYRAVLDTSATGYGGDGLAD